jgi:hypothetical protein
MPSCGEVIPGGTGLGGDMDVIVAETLAVPSDTKECLRRAAVRD